MDPVTHSPTHPHTTVIAAEEADGIEPVSPSSLRTETVLAGVPVEVPRTFQGCTAEELQAAHSLYYRDAILDEGVSALTETLHGLCTKHRESLDAVVTHPPTHSPTESDAPPPVASGDIGGGTPLLEEPIFLEMRTIPADKFRINNQRLFLTYARSDFDKAKLKDHIQAICKSPGAKVKIARETHKDGSFHMHVLVDFRRRFQTTSSRFFDYEGRHPNIKVVADLIHWANLLVYLGKEDKSCSPHPAVKDAAMVWSCSTLSEAMLSGACGGRPHNIRDIWSAKPRKNEFMRSLSEPNAPWYREILKPIIDGESDHRSWHWFCDKVGNSQKSYTCKYYRSVQPDDVRATKLTANLDSFAMKMANWQRGGWSGRVMLIDLARGKANTSLIYECLEMISDGWGDSGKYEGQDFFLDVDPIVVVFANWWPRIDDTTGSADRWKLYEICNDPVPLSARRMNLNSVRADRYDRDHEAAMAKLEERELAHLELMERLEGRTRVPKNEHGQYRRYARS